MKQTVRSRFGAQGVIETNQKTGFSARVGSIYEFECRDKFGNIKWTDRTHNLVVNAGLNHVLSVITATAHVANWYVGLYATGYTPNATDVATTNGFTVITPYSEVTLPSYSAGAISGQAVDNSANKAAFSVTTAATTVGGAYMINGNNKAAPTTGALLFGVANLTTPRAVANGDTLNVTITVGAEVT